MDWTNWTTYATSVFNFFLSLFTPIVNLIMSTPIIGVPVIVMIIGMILGLVVRFVGAFGSKGKNEN